MTNKILQAIIVGMAIICTTIMVAKGYGGWGIALLVVILIAVSGDDK